MAAGQGVRLALLVESHHHRRGAVAPAQPRLFEEGVFAAFQADRVDHALALGAAQAGLDHAPIAGVDHHRHAGDVRLAHGEVEEAAHGGHAVGHALVEVDIDELRPVLHLFAGDLQRRGEIAVFDQAAKPRRAGHVGALADVHEQGVVVDHQRFEPGQGERRFGRRRPSRRGAGGARRQGADVLRRGAAATADDVHQAPVDEVADCGGHFFGGFVVTAELVRQAGVRVRAHERGGDARQGFHMRSQRFRPQRAVQAHDQRLRVANRMPERLGRLPGERPPARIHDGAGNHDGQRPGVVEQRIEREQRRLAIQRVEHGFQEQQVDAAGDQRLRRFPIGLHQFREADVARPRIVDIRGNARRAVGGAQHAGDPTRLRGSGERIRGAAGDGGGFVVDLAHRVLQAVVGLGDARGGEGVGGDDVRARRQVGAVDVLHRIRSRQRKNIAIALQRLVVVGETPAAVVGFEQAELLQHRAHGAVEHQHALAERLR